MHVPLSLLIFHPTSRREILLEKFKRGALLALASICPHTHHSTQHGQYPLPWEVGRTVYNRELLIISCDIWQADCSSARRGRAELGQGGGGCSAVVPSVQSGGVGVEWGVVVWNSPLGNLWRRAGPAG